MIARRGLCAADTVGVNEADEEGHGGKLRLDCRLDEHLAVSAERFKGLPLTTANCNLSAITVILSLSFRNFATFTMA